MATLKYYLDTRRVRKDGTYGLKVLVCSKGTKAYIQLPSKFSFKESDWIPSAQQVKKTYPDYRSLNKELFDLIQSMTDKMESEFGVYTSATASKIASKLRYMRDPSSSSVVAIMERYAQLMTKPNSKESYLYTARTIKRYDSLYDELQFSDIDKEWLCCFRDWVLQTCKQNTAAIHLENIRAVFNYAIEIGITTNYPFKTFHINRKYDKKETLSVETLREFFRYVPAYPSQQYFLDMWMISFGLCGINMADLYVAKDSQIVNGRFQYNREKTGVFASIKVEPEVMALINKHRGKNGMLLDMSEKRAKVKSFWEDMNASIKTWGPWHREGRSIVYESHPYTGITSYTARREWSTMASELDINIPTIAKGMAHADGGMTMRYISTNDKKLDNANRKVLDYCGFDTSIPLSDLCQPVCHDGN